MPKQHVRRGRAAKERRRQRARERERRRARAVIVRLPTRRDHDPYRPGWIRMIGELEEVARCSS